MPRRTTALAAFALVLAPVLSSCGFEEATDFENNIIVGANDRSGEVDVLAAVVVSAEDGEGVFVATLTNTSTTEPITLIGITGEGLTITEPSMLEVRKGGFVNLAEGDTPIEVSGDFEAGNYVPVTLEFSNGEQAVMQVPVRRNCGDYADVSGLPDGEDVCPSGNDLMHEGDH